MAHSFSSTTTGYGELGRLFAVGEAASGAHQMVLIGNVGCTANEAQTYAGIDAMGEAGLTPADATVSAEDGAETDDTCQLTHTFTAGATGACLGAAMANDDDDIIFMIVCWENTINLENGDTITPTLSLKFEAN